jgi:hypothetical protein
MARTLNTGRNALTDALVDGRAIDVLEVAVGRDGASFAESQTDLQDPIAGAEYATTNRRRATGTGRYDASIPESSVADGETLRELVVRVDDGSGGTEAIARIPFAETDKVSGSELVIETTSEVTNP